MRNTKPLQQACLALILVTEIATSSSLEPVSVEHLDVWPHSYNDLIYNDLSYDNLSHNNLSYNTLGDDTRDYATVDDYARDYDPLDYDPMAFTIKGDKIVASGVIDETSLAKFKQAVAKAPQAKTLVLRYVEGSVDDDANLLLARFVRQKKFATYVPAQGLIASGGTDLFLAGVKRSLAAGACVGVHTWAADEENGELLEGRHLPRSDELHQPYLAYFDTIGISRDFYWYTLEAADSEEMHWMSRAEAKKYQLTTDKPQRLSSAAVCDERFF